MKEINIGFIGAGLISLAHGLSVKSLINNPFFKDISIKLKKAADIDQSAIERFCNITGTKETTTNPMDIINDDSINVVYILTPTRYHKEYFLSAAEKGKHIFCEKPLAFSLFDIKEMIKVRDKNNILAQVGLVLRFCPIFWYIKSIIEDNKQELGKLLTAIMIDDQEWPIAGSSHVSDWRKDKSVAHAGCLFEHSIHDADILEYLFGSMKNLFARIRYISPEAQAGLEDLAILSFEFQNDGTGTLTSIWHKIRRDFRHLELYFENGNLILQNYTGLNFKSLRGKIRKRKLTLASSYKEIKKEYIETNNLPNLKTGVDTYSYENFAFIKSLIEETSPYPSLEIGLRAHEIVEAAYKSSNTKKLIEL
ncbi:MAG: Gfo/Idh/MocA family protein [Candidatus Hodarchaeota archaeon]